jgi:hypothetical protein
VELLLIVTPLRLRRSMQNETADQASRRGDVRHRLACGDVKQGHASLLAELREEAMLKGIWV